MLRTHLCATALLVAAGSPSANEISFSKSRLVSPHDSMRDADVFDVDGDGDLDYILQGDSQLEWFENVDGKGARWEERVIDPAIVNRSVAAINVDPDGDGDVIGGGSGGELALFRNLGGAWSKLDLVPAGGVVLQIRVGRIDADAHDDILIATNVGATWRAGDGAGSFGPDLVVGGDVCNDAILADVDGDLDLDVLIGDGPGGAIDWFENTDGLGAFALPVPVGPQPSVESLAANDLDGDGDTDVVAISTDGVTLRFENLDGAGTFGPGIVVHDPAPGGGGPAEVAAVDLDGDGDTDLLVNPWAPSQPLISFENRGGGNFALAKTHVQKRPQVRVGDFDGNGLPDAMTVQAGVGVNLLKNLTGLRPRGRRPGSALLFPVQRSGAGFFTIVSVTNTHTLPSGFGQVGGTTLAHYQYVNTTPNPLDPLRPTGCTIVDRVETLTPADTLTVLTSCHNAGNGVEGYLLVTAQDPLKFDTPWSHNYLVGSELVVNASGGAYAINAVSLAACADPGDPTDADDDGLLDLDAFEYQPGADVLYLDTFLAAGGSHLALVNLTGGPNAENVVRFDLWNDNELPFSAITSFRCWFDQPLTVVSPVFDPGFIANLPNDPFELDTNCDGADDFDLGWARIESLGVFSPQGSVSNDGLLVGAITSGIESGIDGGRLLWESRELQLDGALIQQ